VLNDESDRRAIECVSKVGASETVSFKLLKDNVEVAKSTVQANDEGLASTCMFQKKDGKPHIYTLSVVGKDGKELYKEKREIPA
jgi:hypothetical protein